MRTVTTAVHRVDVEVETQYLESQSDPEERRYVFAYTITNRNTGSVGARLISRHWVITDADGGDFRINNGSGYANAALNLADLVNAYSLTGSASLGALSGSAGSVLSSTAWTIGAKNTDSTFTGTITGNSLTKVGSGVLTLAPAGTTSLATSTTSGSTSVTLTSTTGLLAQMPVAGTGIPAGTRIASVNSTTSLTLTQPATATGTGPRPGHAHHVAMAQKLGWVKAHAHAHRGAGGNDVAGQQRHGGGHGFNQGGHIKNQLRNMGFLALLAIDPHLHVHVSGGFVGGGDPRA